MQGDSLLGRKMMAYYRDMPVGARNSELDSERRSIKGFVSMTKCPGCGWTPQWKSAIGPHPLQTGDTVYCSIKCFESRKSKIMEAL